MKAEIRPYNGTPTLFLDGQPVFDGLFWGSGPDPDGWRLAASGRKFAEAGVHLYAFDVGTGGPHAEWCGPKPGRPEHWDFSSVEERFGRIIDVDPQAHFHLRVHLEMPDWWRDLYPDECERDDLGVRQPQSFASTVWREQAKAFLRAYTAQFKSIGLAERVIAYQTGAGHTGEWCRGGAGTGMALRVGDYSAPMRRHFRAWLATRYQGNEAALRQAWANPQVTFGTAEVPPAAAQLGTTAGTFRDPAAEQAVIDYLRCLSELCASLVIDFNRTVKEATGGQALAGAFYGYILEMAWNAGFFGEGYDSDYTTTQRSGHLGLRHVLSSPYVDFIVSPYSYGFRGIGGDGAPMPPTESARLHGKLYILEEDTRTHLNTDTNFGRVYTPADNDAVLKRNLAGVLVRGLGTWWLGEPGHIDPSRDQGIAALLKRFMELGNWAVQLDRTPAAEIAMFVDDESFFYETLRTDYDLPALLQQRLWGIPRIGAPCDNYLLQDLVEGKVRPYKLYIFPNALRMDAARRADLTHELRRAGRVALWIYGPGYAGDAGLSLDHMQELTGMQFGMDPRPWGPLVHITNFQHPITRGLRQDLFWGTSSHLAPLFHVRDEEALTLGQSVGSQGQCKPGLAVKEGEGWASVYAAAPNIPAPVLRGVARYAGVHLYSEAGDVLYATPQLLAVHTTGGGPRVFKLPRRAEVVCDLFTGQVVARNADEFQVTLPPASTTLWFTGEAGVVGPVVRGT